MKMKMKMNKKTKRIFGGLIAGALSLTGLVTLAPASQAATTTVTIDCSSDVTIYGVPGDQFEFSLLLANCGNDGFAGFYYLYNSPDADVDGWLKRVTPPTTTFWQFIRESPSTAYATSVLTELLPTNTPGTSLTVGSAIAMMDGDVIDYYVYYGGTTAPADPSVDPSGGAAAPVEEFSLSLSVSASGTTCTGDNLTAVVGTWLVLPSADQCKQSGPTAKAGATLLGWSTSANFPIARAQSQIDKGWGVIDETIDGLRAIFIPAGMATFVSGDNDLYPVWSK